MTATLAPTLAHALGKHEDRRAVVRFAGPTNLGVYKFVRCEHPGELLEVLKGYDLNGIWLDADDGSVFRVGAMYSPEIKVTA